MTAHHKSKHQQPTRSEFGYDITYAEFINARLYEAQITSYTAADELGYSKPTMISMIRNGKVKLAIAHVPTFEKLLKLGEGELLRRVLAEDQPDLLKGMEALWESPKTEAEGQVLGLFRQLYTDTGKPRIKRRKVSASDLGQLTLEFKKMAEQHDVAEDHEYPPSSREEEFDLRDFAAYLEDSRDLSSPEDRTPLADEIDDEASLDSAPLKPTALATKIPRPKGSRKT